jgi:hypothetical protein
MAETPQTPVQKYLDIIAAYDSEFKKWEARVVKLLKRFRSDNRSPSDNEAAQFNIFWSNVNTLIPAVFARMPKAAVSRRFVDNDPIGRVASLLIERNLDYEIEHLPDFRSAMHNCVEDRFLGGRGTAWVRYDPHITAQDDGQITEDVPDPQDHTTPGEPAEQIDYECSPTDYVYWRDFGHTAARTWEEVTCVWRWVYMTEEALKARFPDKWKQIPLDTGPQKLERSGRGEKVNNNCAKVCELWDKERGRAVWLSKHLPDLIDERDDPLDLEGFFPCPKPLYATTTTDTLVPVPDLVLYQDQANELDILSDRIDGLVKALRVRGIYDASIPELQRLLTEGDNNTLIGTSKWQQFSEKGGLKGAIDLLPINDIASALMQAYQARADIKSQVYEITGISDIVRGQGAASETATAQQIKGQYAGLRLKSMQESVAMFATELLRIKAQIICTKYQDKTITDYAAAEQMSQEDQAMIPAALQLIRNEPLRCFRIEVAADSLVQIDEQQTQADRVNFLNTFATFLREAVPAGQQVPEMVPAIVGALKFGVAGFKQARSLEGVLDAALQQLQIKAANNAANPPPNPELQKAQAKAQADAQAAQMQAQADAQVEQMRAQMQAHLQTMKQNFDGWEAKLKAATQIAVAQIAAKAQTDAQAAQAESDASLEIISALGDGLSQHLTNKADAAFPQLQPQPQNSGA